MVLRVCLVTNAHTPLQAAVVLALKTGGDPLQYTGGWYAVRSSIGRTSTPSTQARVAAGAHVQLGDAADLCVVLDREQQHGVPFLEPLR